MMANSPKLPEYLQTTRKTKTTKAPYWKIRSFIQFLPLWLFERLYLFLPEFVSRAFLRMFVSLFYKIQGRRRKVVLANLGQAFPNLDLAERERLAKATYASVAKVLYTGMLIRHLNPAEWPTRIDFEGLDAVKQAFAQNHGVILNTGHFGGWVLPVVLPLFGLPMRGLFFPPANIYYHNWCETTLTKHGVSLIFRRSKSEAFALAKTLKRGEILGMAADLNFPNSPVFLDFFGRPATFGEGPYRLALSMKAPLFYVSTRCLPGGRFHMKFVPICTDFSSLDSSQSTAELVTSMAKKFRELLEADIVKHPDEFFWFNKRWKTQPEGSKFPKLYD